MGGYERCAIVILLVALATSAYAQQGAETDEIKTGQLTETSAGNSTAQGGNVTMINLTTTQSTSRWQGYYGNVTGSLSLGFGSSIFYDFSSTSTSVFASRNASFDFTLLEAATPAEIDTRWSYASGADMAVNIFTNTTDILGVTAPSVELEPTDSNFNTTILKHGTNESKLSFAFGVNVQEPGVACFDGTTCEYELMVPADGQEVYYFFMSI